MFKYIGPNAKLGQKIFSDIEAICWQTPVFEASLFSNATAKSVRPLVLEDSADEPKWSQVSAGRLL